MSFFLFGRVDILASRSSTAGEISFLAMFIGLAPNHIRIYTGTNLRPFERIMIMLKMRMPDTLSEP